MKKCIIIIFAILISIQVASAANYGEGAYGCGLYGIGCGPSEEAEGEEEQHQTGEGTGAVITQQQEITEETINQTIELLLCPSNASFISRLMSKCQLDNGICDDGENYIINSDCDVTIYDLKTGKIFTYMWFLRFVLLFSIFLLARDSKQYPLIVIILVTLFVYNGAFIPNDMDYDPLQCMDVNFFINMGYCIMPANPSIGWVIGFIMAVMMAGYFTKKRKPRKKKGRKEEKTRTNIFPLIFLGMLLIYSWALMAGQATYDPKCTDVGFILNFGECIMPARPVVGWMIGGAIAISALMYIFRPIKKKKTKNYITENYINK